MLRFGNARELVLGLEVVLADGRVWDGLRRLRKDNTGYDLKQIFLGSEGTLGIITAAVLKLFPRPRSSATAFAALAHIDDAVSMLSVLRQALGDRLTGFELVSAECIELTRAKFPALPDPLPGHAWYALVQADDPAAESPLAAQLESALGDAIERGIARDAAIAQSEAQGAELWAMREHIPEAQRREGPNIKHDISLPVSSIPAFLAEARAALDAAFPGVRYVVFGHLGDGNRTTTSRRRPAPTRQRSWTRAPAPIASSTISSQASAEASAQSTASDNSSARTSRAKPAVEVELMRRIKHALDPHQLLNPGKVL